MRNLLSVLAIALLTTPLASAKDPTGVLAASCGDQVVLLSPSGGGAAAFDTGPVGWLYPAPGARLFAPDLVNGATTILSTAPPRVVERLDGVTMPLFGSLHDRYVVVGPGRVLAASYPGRAIIARWDIDVRAPWRSLIDPEGRFVFVVERGSTSGHGTVTAVNVLDGSVGARSPLETGVTDVAMTTNPPVLAFAARADGAIRLRAAATLAPGTVIETGTEIAGIATCRSQWLAAAVRNGERGAIQLWKLASGTEIEVKPKQSTELPTPPTDITCSPDGEWIAVAVDGPEVLIFRWKDADVVTRIGLPAPPRDLVWTDPTLPGPLWPRWSDRE